MAVVEYPPLVRKDTGLGSAFERIVIYRLIARWIAQYPVKTAMEGVFDGMAGIPGLQLLPAAIAGARVTVVCPNAEMAETVDSIYRLLGLSDRLRLIIGPDWPEGETAELVMIFNALAFVPDWRVFLRKTASRSSRFFIVSTTNPLCYGAFLCRILRILGLKRNETELFDHPSAHRSSLEPELRSLGRILDRSYVDAPWWPDLFVKPGDSLISGTLRSLPGRADSARRAIQPSARSLRHSYGPDCYPYLERTEEDRKIVGEILRQPNADTAPFLFLRPLFAHHRMTLVDVRG